MPNKTVTVKSSGGDYTSLAAALAGESANLVANTCVLTIECYAMEDTAAADTGTGYTTSADYYINIVVPTNERHLGKWSGDKYRISVANTNALIVQTPYTRVGYLQLKVTKSNSNWPLKHVLSVLNGGDYSQIHHNVVYASGNYYGAGIHLAVNVGTRVWNNIAYSDGSAIHASHHGIGDESPTSPGNYFYNNTSYGWYYGFQTYSTNYNTYINNLAANSASSGFYASSWPASCDYNASDDDKLPGGEHDRSGQTFTFVDAANQDFHLASNDSGAKDHGVSDPGSGLFSDDIDGETRSGSWDIGADEYVAAASGLSHPVAQHYYNQMRH